MSLIFEFLVVYYFCILGYAAKVKVIPKLNDYLELRATSEVIIYNDPAEVEVGMILFPITSKTVNSSASNLCSFPTVVTYDTSANRRPNTFSISHVFLFYDMDIQNYFCSETCYPPHPPQSLFEDYTPSTTLLIFTLKPKSQGHFPTCNHEVQVIVYEIEEQAGSCGYDVVSTQSYKRLPQGGILLVPLVCSTLGVDGTRSKNICTQKYGLEFIYDSNIHQNFLPRATGFKVCDEFDQVHLTDKLIDKYIGSPFEMQKLYKSTQKYAEGYNYRSYFLNFIYFSLSFGAANGCYNGASFNLTESSIEPLIYGTFLWTLEGIRKDHADKLGMELIPSYLGFNFAPEDPHTSARLIITDVVRHRFATCDRVRSNVDFEIFVVAFDPNSWALIALTAFIIIPLFMACVGATKGLPQKSLMTLVRETFSSSVFLLLDIGISLTDSFLSLIKLKYTVRIVFGAWLMILLVVVNAYKGIFTAIILVPPQPTHFWTKCYDLDGFHVKMTETLLKMLTVSKLTKVTYHDIGICDCIEMGNGVVGASGSDCPVLKKYRAHLDYFIKKYTNYKGVRRDICREYFNVLYGQTPHTCRQFEYSNSPGPPPILCTEYRNLTLPNWSILSGTQFIEKKNGKGESIIAQTMFVENTQFTKSNEPFLPILQKCDKTAIIDTEENVHQLIIKTAFSHIQSAKDPTGVLAFSTGDETFFPIWDGFSFLHGQNARFEFSEGVQNRIFDRLRRMMEHGILATWRSNYDRFLGNSHPSIKRMEETIQFHAKLPKVMKFDLRLIYIFLIWITCIIVTVIFLGIELLTCTYFNFMSRRNNKVMPMSSSLISVNTVAKVIMHPAFYDTC